MSVRATVATKLLREQKTKTSQSVLNRYTASSLKQPEDQFSGNDITYLMRIVYTRIKKHLHNSNFQF